jgi:hypothetical protein
MGRRRERPKGCSGARCSRRAIGLVWPRRWGTPAAVDVVCGVIGWQVPLGTYAVEPQELALAVTIDLDAGRG